MPSIPIVIPGLPPEPHQGAAQAGLVEQQQRARAALDATQRTRRALKAGDHALDFCLPDQQGRKTSLAKALVKGPVLLMFCRGPWCPNVRAQLEELAALYVQMPEHAHSVIVMAPRWSQANAPQDDPDGGAEGFPFATLADPHCEVATSYGLTFLPDVHLRPLFEQLGYCEPDLSPGEPLIIPATYVINRSAEIAFASIDSDPANCLQPQALLRLLETLARRQGF